MTEIPAHLLRRAQAAREKAADEPIRQAEFSAPSPLSQPSPIISAGSKNTLVSSFETRARALDAAVVFTAERPSFNRDDVLTLADKFEKYLLGELE